jgi:Fe-S-cluster containining protein
VTLRAAGHEPGAVESALEELWSRSRYRLYHPKNVWRWLDLRRRFELRFLRASAMRVAVPARLLPDCATCTDICCTGPNAVVSLRLADIAALVDAGLERHVVHERPDADGDASWARQEADWSVFHRMFPVLQRDVTGTCALLTEDRMCGAYPAWPLSCARYPYALDVLNSRVFLAKGCESHRLMSADDAPDAVRRLVDAAVRGYNERLRDVILLHVALDELQELDLLRFLQPSRGRWQKRFARAQSHAPAREVSTTQLER